MKTIELEIGSPKWVRSRSASKAPAMMGASKYQSRTGLMRQMATGIAPDVDSGTQARFDAGHASEAAARDIAEDILCDGLSPVCGESDDGYLTASFDGLTFDGRVGFEHKLWNEDLADAVRAGELPEEYKWQMDQQILVGGLDYVLFMCSNGTREQCVSMEYRSTPERAATLLAAWRQLDVDLANYVPQEIITAVVAAPIRELPTLFVQARGEVTKTNMPEFKAQITEFLGTINMVPATDQEFADGKEIAKKLRELAVKIKERKADMLEQTLTIGEVAKEIDHLAEIINRNALELEKAVKREEDARKLAIISDARTAFANHIAMLNTRLGKPYLPAIQADFAEAIKGKRLITAMQDAASTLLANKKIEANEIADKIEINMKWLRENAADFAFLFADTAQIVLKANDDFAALATMRINAHKAAETKRIEDERAKLEAEAVAKVESERARIRAEEEVKAAKAAHAYRLAEEADLVARERRDAAERAATQEAAARPAVAQIDTGARINLGDICERLAIAGKPMILSAAQLAALGFEPVETIKASKVYRAHDFTAICAALMRHVSAASREN